MTTFRTIVRRGGRIFAEGCFEREHDARAYAEQHRQRMIYEGVSGILEVSKIEPHFKRWEQIFRHWQPAVPPLHKPDRPFQTATVAA